MIQPYIVESLPLTEARLRISRTSLFIRPFTRRHGVISVDLALGGDTLLGIF
jgi:hypothetical protein